MTTDPITCREQRTKVAPFVDNDDGERKMATEQVMRECNRCGKPTLHLIQQPNHILHLLLSLVTFGGWLIIWFLIGQSAKEYQCTMCAKPSRQTSGLTWLVLIAILIFAFAVASTNATLHLPDSKMDIGCLLELDENRESVTAAEM